VQIAGVSDLDVFSNPYLFIPELKARKEKTLCAAHYDDRAMGGR
jgi:hypothetical protein